MTKPSEHKDKRQALRDIILNCPIYQESSEEENVFYGCSIESGNRMELHINGNNFKLFRGEKKIKNVPIRDIDVTKFKAYIYDIVGARPPKE